MYKAAIQESLATVRPYLPEQKTERLSSSDNGKELIIIVGSQKGLCGNFNTKLLQYFEKDYRDLSTPKPDIIVIGKKAAEYLDQKGIATTQSYNTFNIHNFVAIAHEITSTLLDNNTYQSVAIYSNNPKSFFYQKPEKTPLLPFEDKRDTTQSSTMQQEEPLWEQPPEALYTYITTCYLKAHIQELLFLSLISEQASRFVSMDSATRNADDMLESLQLEYNKMRQASITRELADLSSSLL
jgi:F-type H+-transporting ATPase subunit gamma